ncbi:MAG: hypothetical protein ABI208_09525 [Ginsengibacter sp.]
MKKIKLNLQSLNAEVLTRSQLKQILGGDGGSGGGSGDGCDPKVCEAKSSPTLGNCVCTRGGQCVCVS